MQGFKRPFLLATCARLWNNGPSDPEQALKVTSRRLARRHQRHLSAEIGHADIDLLGVVSRMGATCRRDPVQLVLDRPMLADDLDQMVGADVAETEVGDRVDGLGVPGTRRGADVRGDEVGRYPCWRWFSAFDRASLRSWTERTMNLCL